MPLVLLITCLFGKCNRLAIFFIAAIVNIVYSVYKVYILLLGGSNMKNIVAFKNVTKSFNGFAIKNMNLTIKKGEITGFIGANGAGKSTTIKLIMNLLQPDTGEVTVFGQQYAHHEKAIKERIGFVYDNNIFYKDLHIKDIRRIVAPAYQSWDNELFNQYIKLFELPTNKAVQTFSKGMQMKVSLAMALSHKAEFILMDEPTAGLDPVFRRELLDILQEIVSDGERSIFFSTHITSDLERIADRVAFIQKGELLFTDTKENIMQNYALVKGATSLLHDEVNACLISIRQQGNHFEALTNRTDQLAQLLGHQVQLEKVSLEDIIFYAKGGKALYV